MFRTVQWTSGSRLSCVGCAPAKVILCIDPDLLAERTCPTSDVLSADTPEGIYSWNTIEAELVDSVQVKNNCGGAYFYRYTFNYDDAFIITGGNLSSSDIIGAVCKGCLTQYAEDLAGNEIVLERVAATLEVPAHMALTSQHGCVYEFYEGTAEPAEPTQCIYEDITATGDSQIVTTPGEYELVADVGPVDIVNPSAVYPASVQVYLYTSVLAATLSPGFVGNFRLYSYPDGVKTLQRTFIYTQAGNIAYAGNIDITNMFTINLAAGQTLTEGWSMELTTGAAGSGVDTVSVEGNMYFFGSTCLSET